MALNLWRPEPKRRAGIVRPPVVPGVPLSRYSNKELAVRLVRRSNLPKQDPGIAWARAMREANRAEKDAAREAVLRLFTVDEFPQLSILTFPASEWRFESALLAMRESENQLRRAGPQNTRIIGLEREEDVFRAAVANIPRGQKKSASRIRVIPAPPYATGAVQTMHISGMYRASFEDFALCDAATDLGPWWFHAAWLDFNGHIGSRRLEAIERFWRDRVRDVLVITIMNGRTHPDVTSLIEKAGRLETMLESRLPGALCESASYYGDGAPMVQIVLRRISGCPIGPQPRSA
jgi:hypothetical protein